MQTVSISKYLSRRYGNDVYDAAQAIYNGEAFGVGTEGDGVLLLLSMWDRS